jgi:dihydroorotate dehydrogenase
MIELLGRKFLQKLPAETAHDLSIRILNSPLAAFAKQNVESNPVNLLGIKFPNPVGLAAGFDKNGDAAYGLSQLGFGFIELGTVTPKPQAGNPKPRLFRLSNEQAIINRMGFNNKGVDYLVKQLERCRPKGIIGINIGKNKVTSNESALDDYLHCFNKVHAIADYVTINISSPNTEDLRQLQQQEQLINLLGGLKSRQLQVQNETGKYTPIVVKIAPDQSDEETANIAINVKKSGMDGIICTNTTINKKNISSNQLSNEIGGLSGKPLLSRSNEIIKVVREAVGANFGIIGVGGILTDDDAMSKIHSGANLIQIYTGLVYQGPELIKRINLKYKNEYK